MTGGNINNAPSGRARRSLADGGGLVGSRRRVLRVVVLVATGVARFPR